MRAFMLVLGLVLLPLGGAAVGRAHAPGAGWSRTLQDVSKKAGAAIGQSDLSSRLAGAPGYAALGLGLVLLALGIKPGRRDRVSSDQLKRGGSELAANGVLEIDKKAQRRTAKQAEALAKKDPVTAAEMLLEAGLADRAADLFIKAEQFVRAAEIRHDQNRFQESAELYQRAGKWDTAGQILSTQSEWAKAAECFLKAGKMSVAAEMFEKRITCDPRSLSAYINASASYMQVKNFQRAHELLTKAVSMKPDFLLGRLWLGRVLSLMDSLDQAKAQYDEVLLQAQSDPAKYKKEIGEAQYMSASYWFQKQQYEKAIDGYRKAQASGYDNADSRFSWGQAVLQTLDPKGDQAENKKRIAEAVSLFRRSVEMNPNNYMSHLWLAQGLVLMRVEGDDEGNRKLTSEACEEYRKVLRLNAGNADAKKGMERISCPGAN